MVVFTCNHCGDGLQKPKVEKHYQMACRNAKYLTCVDCLKDFRGEEYVEHTKCVSELERYSAKGSTPTGAIKKGEAKQESWTEMIKSIIGKETSLIPQHRNLLNTVAASTNVPRKRPKFMNFIKSSSGGRVNMKDVEAVWDIIEKYKKESFDAKQINTKEDKNEENINKRKADGTDILVNKKKQKNKENEDVKANGKVEKNDFFIESNGTENAAEALKKFSFKTEILDVLNQKKSISLKKLKKKVLNAYLKHSGESQLTDATEKKFHKKLKKIDQIKINEDNVTLTLQE